MKEVRPMEGLTYVELEILCRSRRRLHQVHRQRRRHRFRNRLSGGFWLTDAGPLGLQLLQASARLILRTFLADFLKLPSREPSSSSFPI